MSISFRGSAQLFNENWWASSRNEIAQTLQQDNELAWSQQRDPQITTGWAPLSLNYKAWKDRNYPGQPILRLTGKMQDDTKIKPDRGVGLFSARMGASYGRYHMTGTRYMPARPWLGVPMISMPKITTAVAKAINRSRTIRF
jgi:phage gpG-like protein